MDLWIRSQDKEDLIKCHNLGLAYNGKYNFMDKIGDIDNYCICEFIDNYHVKLASYKTKERALEVLDEIHNATLGIITDEDIKDQNKQKYTGNVMASNITKNVVYEMPKEN